MTAQEWTDVPQDLPDPRWEPFRLCMARPRWWRPWWTARVDYVGAWVSHGDQRLITARSWDRKRARCQAIDTLIYHCQWLADGPFHVEGSVPVVWLGVNLVPVTHLAGQTADDQNTSGLGRGGRR